MPPLLTRLPGPTVPAGMLARAMDPDALIGLGFGRDAVACAMLVPPDERVLERLPAEVEALMQIRVDASRAAMQAAGRCTCDAAEVLGMRALIRSCLERATEARCDREADASEVSEALAPLQQALAETPRPLVHWRLVGRTDRPGSFARDSAALVARYEGGSTVFVAGQAVPRRHNHAWVKHLLGLPDVTAVVVQDAGRATMVVREVGRLLVIDHLAYPPTEPANVPMLALWDNARLDEAATLLARPTEARSLGFSPAEGNLVEVDGPGLAAVDRAIDAAGPLRGPIDEEIEVLATTGKIDRVTLQAPFGREGQELRARVRLSASGQAWAAGLGGVRMSPTLDELGLSLEPPAEDDDAAAVAGPWLRALEPWAWAWKRIEMEHPGTIGGTAQAWDYAVPTSDLSDVFGIDAGWPSLREAIGARPYRLQVTLDRDRETLTAELRPR